MGKSRTRSEKPATKREKKRAEAVDFHASELAEKAKGGDADAMARLTRIVTSFEKLKMAEAKRAKVMEEQKQNVGEAEAAFANTIEEAHDIGATEADHSRKLRKVEVLWQNLTDKKAQAKELDSAAKKDIKHWNGLLRDAMKESAQMTLSGKDEGDETVTRIE